MPNPSEFNTIYTALSAEHQLRYDLALVHRYLVDHHWHEGVVNHLTCLLPNSQNHFLALPYGLHWSEVTASDFIVVDLDGNVLRGKGEIERSNINIHGALHGQCPQARAILHTHQANIVAFTLLEDPSIHMVSQHALRFAGRIAYLNEYGDPDNPTIGDAIVASLSDHDVLMCANHGVIICRPTLWDAFDDLYFLDRACELQLLALSTGKSLKIIPDDEAQNLNRGIMKWSKQEGEKHFQALRRLYYQRSPELLD